MNEMFVELDKKYIPLFLMIEMYQKTFSFLLLEC